MVEKCVQPLLPGMQEEAKQNMKFFVILYK